MYVLKPCLISLHTKINKTAFLFSFYLHRYILSSLAIENNITWNLEVFFFFSVTVLWFQMCNRRFLRADIPDAGWKGGGIPPVTHVILQVCGRAVKLMNSSNVIVLTSSTPAKQWVSALCSNMPQSLLPLINIRLDPLVFSFMELYESLKLVEFNP